MCVCVFVVLESIPILLIAAKTHHSSSTPTNGTPLIRTNAFNDVIKALGLTLQGVRVFC